MFGCRCGPARVSFILRREETRLHRGKHRKIRLRFTKASKTWTSHYQHWGIWVDRAVKKTERWQSRPRESAGSSYLMRSNYFVLRMKDSSICASVVSEVGPDLGTTAAPPGFGLKQLVLGWFEAENMSAKSSTIDESPHVHWCLCWR